MNYILDQIAIPIHIFNGFILELNQKEAIKMSVLPLKTLLKMECFIMMDLDPTLKAVLTLMKDTNNYKLKFAIPKIIMMSISV